jgi:AcrR family transcriptional regulator
MRLQAVIEHDAVTAPRQERSQRTLERILAALGELLSEKAFDEISMAELAERAGCAVTSIYARFKDKWSMIAALHESFRDDAMVHIDTFLAPERWRGATADAIIAATTTALVAAYDEHRHLMRAVLLADAPDVYARAASVERHAAERLLRALPTPAGVAAGAFERRVHFGVSVVMAALQQRVLFGAGAKPQAPRSNAELARELAALLTSYVECPRRGGRGSRRPTARRVKKGVAG